MTFQWPEFLSLLAALPLLAAFYLYVLRRKKKFAVRYSNMALVKEAMRGPSWRRHVPPFLLGLALAALIVAIARPSAMMTLPSQHETVILAMDVSGSMRASDVEPNRLAAAQAAAKAFIADQPESVRIGIVAFAGTATVAQAPTKNKEDLYAAIDRFQLQRATAIGSAIIVSLATLFPDGGYDVSTFSYGAETKRKPPANFKPVPPGSYTSAVIILLTDGQRTTGPDSVMAARIVYFVHFFDMVGGVVEDWFREAIGLPFQEMHLERRIGFPIVNTGCEFFRPAHLGDTLRLELGIAKLGRSSIEFRVRGSVGAEEKFRARHKVAMVSLASFKSLAIPPEMRSRMAPYVLADDLD